MSHHLKQKYRTLANCSVIHREKMKTIKKQFKRLIQLGTVIMKNMRRKLSTTSRMAGQIKPKWNYHLMS